MRKSLSLFAFLLGSGSVLGSGSPRATIAPEGGLADRPSAWQDERGWHVGRDGAGAVDLKLPAGATVESILAPSPDSWLAAGVRPVAGGRELWVVSGSAAGAVDVSAPAVSLRRGRIENPVLLRDAGGRLAGIAWLAGERRERNAVWTARWRDLGWEEPHRVAEPGPGSQLALVSEPLADGRQLLVWSRFDGQDDEIVYSVGGGADGRSWSAPEPISGDNSVPDITPALATVAGRPLVAWSRFDGREYQVVTARFDGRRWSSPLVAAPPGSTFPSFSRPSAAAAPLLVWHDARRRTWAVGELDAEGSIGRRTEVGTLADPRPSVISTAQDGIRVRLAGRDLTARWARDSSVDPAAH
ncbi:MAG: hypothetical protein U0X73_02500 [Thermoanaerobaculia bacterium]